jgi:hypothetical protein
VDFIASFDVGDTLRKEILRRLSAPATPETSETTKRRAALEDRLRRARDLYEIGDLPRPEYIARRDAIHAELSTLAPQPIPDLDQARDVLEDFAMFWRTENDPNAKRQFLSLVFDGVGRRPRRRGPAQALIPAVLREQARRSGRRGGGK